MKKIFSVLFFVLITILLIIQLQPKPIKYIFLIIGDGMSMSSEFALSQFLYGKDKQLFWNKFPTQLFMTTWSLSSYEGDYDKTSFDGNKGYNTEIAGIVPYPYYQTDKSEQYFKEIEPTDSSAAATAMATGQKVDNDSVCFDKRENRFINNIVDNINEAKKYNVALMTTDVIYGATPASFFSHSKSRYNEKEIAEQIFSDTRPKIVVGKNDIDELKDFVKDNGYYELDMIDLNNTKFSNLKDSNVFINLNKYCAPVPQENFSIEPFKYDNKLKFSDTILYATRLLLNEKKPFFSLIEICDIDKNNHENNYNGMLGAMYELNETVKSICDLINSKTTDMTFNNTLIIVTADHSTGMLRFNEYLGKGKLPTTEFVYDRNINASVEINKEINYKSVNHTNELVGCYLIGANSNMINKYIHKKNIIDNIDIYNVLKDVISQN